MSILFILPMLFMQSEAAALQAISPMQEVLYSLNYNERIDFLISHQCPPGNRDKVTLILELNGDGGENGENPECGDTIGFLPINKKRIQVFVTANKYATKIDTITTGSTSTVTDKTVELVNVELVFWKKEALDPADPSLLTTIAYKLFTCDKDGMLTGVDAVHSLFKVAETDTILPIRKNLEKNDATSKILHPIVQCKSVYIDMENFDYLKAGYWNLVLNYTDYSNNSDPIPLPPKIYTTYFVPGTPAIPATPASSGVPATPRIDKTPDQSLSIEYLKKVRCDQDKLTVSPKVTTDEINYKQLLKEASDMELVDSKEKPFFKFKINGSACANQSMTMTYTRTKNNGTKDTGFASSVECKNKNDKWIFAVEGNNNVDLDEDDSVEVECLQHKCRKCGATGVHKKCPNDVQPCDPINITTPNEYDKCYELNIAECTSGIVRLNEVFQKIPTENIKCDGKTEKFYHNGQEILKINCVKSFSVDYQINTLKKTKTDVPTTIERPILFKNAKHCNNITHGCQCIPENATDNLQYFLAMSDKEGKAWLRLNSLIFNVSENIWEYERTVANGTVTDVLKDGRAVKCIAAFVVEKLANPSSGMVFGVNIALLVAVGAIAVPGVIFFINARIKKREARKAAKKDKKKEDASGEKGKNDDKVEEKKNEA
ncbi:hypothetical protein PRIPAC_72731 [Pristionchus pacificus]|uniref:Uncharacterized protein n=1 Tax=Pristionchus pacificus TaxID=54126 RepID=A0A2A6CFG2_PRIPA|nr:hypothetical protein PRIPAC_72731 [Pristionchus pacificus]|eukprot:PDM76793.1 hypothetical protein PRIPAC_42188 [Pristionchus pacificus]